MSRKNILSTVIVAVMFVIGVSAFMSCEKEKTTEPISHPTNRVEQTKIFKELGVKHNQILEYVGKNCVPDKSTPEERFYIAKQITASKSNWKETELVHKDIRQIVENKVQASKGLFSEKGIPSEIAFLFDSLNAILDYSVNQVEVNNIVTPEEYNQKVNNLIDYVYDNYDVYYDNVIDSANTYAAFVADCYVSMSSYEFWYDAATDETNPWHNYLSDDNKNIFGRIWHAIKVAAVDTWGFVKTAVVTIDKNGWKITIHIEEAVESAGEESASVPPYGGK